MTAIKQALLIIVISGVLGLGINAISPNAIPYIGQYRELSGGDGPVVPPEASPGDPPFIALDVAHTYWVNGRAVFVDAREPGEFECGTIPGSVNMPFDYLPEGDLAPYFDSVLAGTPKSTPIVTFCSGEECDLSLHLARNMQAKGYTNLHIFFGGAREWENADLEMERRAQCGE